MCLDDQILNTYLDGELIEPWKSQVEEHLGYCNACSNRYKSLLEIHNKIKRASLGDKVINERKEQVLTYLENNKLNKENKSSFFKKHFSFSFTQFAGVAAAFVIVFVGSLALVSGRSSRIDVPQLNSPDLRNVSPVSYTTQQRTLDSFTTEEILQNLESRGLIVTVQTKSVTR